jgi:hypothetical protein
VSIAIATSEGTDLTVRTAREETACTKQPDFKYGPVRYGTTTPKRPASAAISSRELLASYKVQSVSGLSPLHFLYTSDNLWLYWTEG